MTTTIGLIGLGAMGAGMAKSLRTAGFALHVFDLRTDVAQAFAAGGGTVCAALTTTEITTWHDAASSAGDAQAVPPPAAKAWATSA